ncbi:Uncharacterised protein [Escherichia coli]|uniref:Uncharacterized protein n=1 Tax=Escherichia coli TaxID=562 RepID=A0A447X4F5_ECOLX|nr:Uncharacterised protein [Escherichia coli]
MVSRTATDPGIQFVGNIARSSACETAVALSASKVNPIRRNFGIRLSLLSWKVER